MHEDLQIIHDSLVKQLEVMDVGKIGEKEALRVAPVAQLTTLTYLTFTLILATQQLVEIKESLQRTEDKELKE